MRTLRFIIEGLSLQKDPQCDFTGIVPGTQGYLKAEFKFNHEWNGCEKIAVFSRAGVDDFPVRIINNVCMIPDKILLRRNFKIQVIGVKPGLRLPTITLEVKQDG